MTLYRHYYNAIMVSVICRSIVVFVPLQLLFATEAFSQDRTAVQEGLQKNVLEDSEEITSWVQSISKAELSEKDKSWVETLLANSDPKQVISEIAGDCKGCNSPSVAVEEPSVVVLLSMSLPPSLFLDYSKQLERHGGAICLKGIPDGGIPHLVRSILRMREEGVVAPIQIDPMLFELTKTTQVPVIVSRNGDSVDTVRGHVSVEFALGLMGRDTKMPLQRQHSDVISTLPIPLLSDAQERP